MQEISKDKDDKTRVHLLFANRAEVSLKLAYSDIFKRMRFY